MKKKPKRRETAVAEAARWREFASDTQKVLLAQQRTINEMEEAIRFLSQPRVGCPECNYSGLVAIDRIDLNTGEVTAVWESCEHCRAAIDQFVDLWGCRLLQ